MECTYSVISVTSTLSSVWYLNLLYLLSGIKMVWISSESHSPCQTFMRHGPHVAINSSTYSRNEVGDLLFKGKGLRSMHGLHAPARNGRTTQKRLPCKPEPLHR
ncbi:hypothetical protein BDN72DRAFT_851312 [Pluteus cervinus]|uniref:Uncharacterized protein n=1 Tax=Pluteus cervinus TaxID=181527 RepID=A0ACD3A0K0_9AGAR|nr:hypothetical protein BDN72DRAFT_851312 [Pluteus cervinus]